MGTAEGGKKASVTNKQKYGEDFYAKIGAMGGKNGHTGGFASSRDLAVNAGRKGGLISKRGWKYVNGKYYKSGIVQKIEREVELLDNITIERADFQDGFNQPTLRERWHQWLIR